MRFVLAFLLVLSAIIAAQTSTPSRNGAKQQQGSDSKADSPPLPKAPAPASESQAGPGQKEHKPQEKPQSIFEKAFAPDTWANWALFVGAIAAAVIALRTLKAIQRESEVIKSIAAAAGDNTKAIEGQAEKTGIVADAAKKSADAARESIILTHRPKIIVRDMVIAWHPLLQRGTCVKKLNETQFDDWQLAGAFYIVNTGNQSATVVSLEQFMSFDELLPFERPHEGGVRKFVGIKLKPGESKRIPFHPIAIGSPDTRTLILGVPMTAIGRVVYEDELGNGRETGFARKFDMKRQRFVAIDDPDYEYAD
jgi:hypothetical protein